MMQSLQSLYREEGQSFGAMALHMLLDMTGLANYTQTAKINITWWYLSYAILNSGDSFALLLPVVILGTAFSYENLFEKLKCHNKKQAVVGIILCSVIVYVAYLCHITANAIFSYTLAAVIPYIAFAYISKIAGVRSCLKYLGKHATNIFLIHTFIYYYYYRDFIYSFHSALYILPVLVVISLLVSIVIELIKKITGYNWLSNKILQYVDNMEKTGGSSFEQSAL